VLSQVVCNTNKNESRKRIVIKRQKRTLSQEYEDSTILKFKPRTVSEPTKEESMPISHLNLQNEEGKLEIGGLLGLTRTPVKKIPIMHQAMSEQPSDDLPTGHRTNFKFSRRNPILSTEASL